MRWGKVFLHWSSSHYRNSVTNINLQDIKTSPLNMQGTLRIKTSSKSWGGIDDGKMPFLPLCVPVGTLEGEQAMQLICGQRNKGDTVIRGCRISGHEDMSTGEPTIPNSHTRVGEPTLVLTNRNIQQRGPCSLPGEKSTAAPSGESAGELFLTAYCLVWISWGGDGELALVVTLKESWESD